jgi:hypothetical protein
MKPMEKEKVQEMTQLFLAALKMLGVRSTIVCIEGLDQDGDSACGVFCAVGCPLDDLAASMRGLNIAIVHEVAKRYSREETDHFLHLMGARAVRSEAEMEQLLTAELPHDEVFELPNTNYRSKIVH